METYTINKIHDKMELDLQVGTKALQKNHCCPQTITKYVSASFACKLSYLLQTPWFVRRTVRQDCSNNNLLFYQIWVQVWHAHDFCTELLRLLNLEGVMNIFLTNGTLKNIQLMNPNILNTLHYHFVIMTFKKTF